MEGDCWVSSVFRASSLIKEPGIRCLKIIPPQQLQVQNGPQ